MMMKEFYYHLLENSDGLILLEPTIYTVEGDLHMTILKEAEERTEDLGLENPQDDLPF